MSTIIFLKSINKIAILAFLLTFSFICYEIYLLIQEKKIKNRPKIPEFKINEKYSQLKTTSIIKQKDEKRFYNKPNPRLIIFLIILMFIFGGLFIIGLLVKEENTSKNSQKGSTAPLVKVVSSSGIKIYNEKWEEMPDSKLKALESGYKVFIGVKNISGIDIDKARIRINADKWNLEDETSKLEIKTGLFYKEYQIATNETKLKIEAQLHSQTEGWLGD